MLQQSGYSTNQMQTYCSKQECCGKADCNSAKMHFDVCVGWCWTSSAAGINTTEKMGGDSGYGPEFLLGWVKPARSSRWRNQSAAPRVVLGRCLFAAKRRHFRVHTRRRTLSSCCNVCEVMVALVQITAVSNIVWMGFVGLHSEDMGSERSVVDKCESLRKFWKQIENFKKLHIDNITTTSTDWRMFVNKFTAVQLFTNQGIKKLCFSKK